MALVVRDTCPQIRSRHQHQPREHMAMCGGMLRCDDGIGVLSKTSCLFANSAGSARNAEQAFTAKTLWRRRRRLTAYTAARIASSQAADTAPYQRRRDVIDIHAAAMLSLRSWQVARLSLQVPAC